MKYPVMEAFSSVQGEGRYTGHPAYFIRLGGCDVGCVWCDVKESWDADRHPQQEVETMVAEALRSGLGKVIITGGEPAMYDLEPLTKALKEAGFQIHIETSGAYPLKGSFDWITFSPKKFKAPLPEIAKRASELKMIVFNKSDFAWAEQQALTVSQQCILYLQPEWDKQEQMTPLIFDYVRQHPQWNISLQVHKFIGVE